MWTKFLKRMGRENLEKPLSAKKRPLPIPDANVVIHNYKHSKKYLKMACVSKIGSLYELVTKNGVVTTTNTIFGINPRIWLSLPCEGLLLLKIRQVVPTTGETLPVQIAIPANSTVSTVGDDTCCPVTGVAVVNPINVAVTGAAMVNNTERLVYFNKVRGVLRLMDCCVPTTSASASETTVDEE